MADHPSPEPEALPSIIPLTHSPTVGFLELFYDLVFVASTMVLSNTFSQDPTWAWAGMCALLFALLWLLWFHTTLLMNVERRDDFGHRSLVLVQMFLISLTSLAFVDRELTTNDYLGVTYGTAVLTVALLYHRVMKRNPDVAVWARSRRNRLLVAGLLIFVNSYSSDGVDVVIFVAAIGLLVVPTSFTRAKRVLMPRIDVSHLTERAALLTLIMCGEAFVKVSLVVSSGTLGRADIIAIVVEFVVVFALFWTYFDDIPLAGIRGGQLAGELWMLAHLPLQLGIVGMAIGMSEYLQVTDHVHDEAILILSMSFVLIYSGLALLGQCGDRLPRGPLLVLRLATVMVSALLGALFWQVDIDPAWLVGLLAVIAVSHALVGRQLRQGTTLGSSVSVAHGTSGPRPGH